MARPNQQCTVVVSSITHAMNGQRLLEQQGIRSYVDRDVDAYGKYGCGYVIRVRNNCQQAVGLLRQAQINIREIVG